jgi:hypothetical protein
MIVRRTDRAPVERFAITLESIAYAFSIAWQAGRLLDAVLEHRNLTADQIRELAVDLEQLDGHVVGGGLTDAARKEIFGCCLEAPWKRVYLGHHEGRKYSGSLTFERDVTEEEAAQIEEAELANAS